MISALFLNTTLAFAAATAPSTTIAPGTYAYASSLNGASIGTTTIVVKNSPSTTEIDETASGTINGVAAHATAMLTLGADLAPTMYSGQYQAGEQSLTSTVVFSGNTANLASATGPKTFQLPADTKHFVVTDGALLAGLLALPAEMHAWNNSPALAVAPIYGQTVPIAIDTTATPARPPSVPATDVAIPITSVVALTVWYNPTTFIADEIDVPSQGLIVTRVKS